MTAEVIMKRVIRVLFAVAAVGALAGCGTAAALPVATPTLTVTKTVQPPKTTSAAPAPTKTVIQTPPVVPVTQPANPVYVPVPANPPASIVNAEAVVTQFYQDITDQDYSAAWALGGSNVSNGVGYDAWVAGYGTTQSVSLGTFSYWGSDTVQVAISATQTDGSVNTYSGTYTVENGIITSANIKQTS
jgi:hypothetical protein